MRKSLRGSWLLLGVIAALGTPAPPGLGSAAEDRERAGGGFVSVRTDKPRYGDGETVGVRIHNGLEEAIRLDACPVGVQRLGERGWIAVSSCLGRGTAFFQTLPAGAELAGDLSVPLPDRSTVRPPPHAPVAPVVRKDDLRKLPPAAPPRPEDPPRDAPEGGGVSASGLRPGTYRLELRFAPDTEPADLRRTHSPEFVVAE